MTAQVERDRGAALLAVLLLVAVMAVIASVMLERLNLATRLAGNAQAMGQARLALAGGESLAIESVSALMAADPVRTNDAIGQLGRNRTFPLGRALITARLDDADNCFNINSLVEPGADGTLATRLVALWQLRALMASLAVPASDAIPLSDALADWIDSDNSPAPNGAEDGWYLGQPVPYRTAGQLIVDPSELRAVKGMTPQLYQRLRPWLCALPDAQLSPVNVDTLRPDQARLLTMLAPAAMPLARAQALIAARPPGGWADTEPALRAFGAGLGASPDSAATPAATLPLGQLQVRSRWFTLTQTVAVDSLRIEAATLIDAGVIDAGLIDAGKGRPRAVLRSWGDAESR